MKKYNILRNGTIILFVLMLFSSCNEEQSGSQQLLEVVDNWKMSRLGSNEKLRTQIPSTVQEILLENDKIPNPYYSIEEENIEWMENESWEYATWFKPDNSWSDFDHLELIFHGLDTYSTIFLNGDTLLSTDNMFRVWKVDITDKISSGRNDLRIIFHPTIQQAKLEEQKTDLKLPVVSYADKVSVFCRKAPFHFGSQLGPRIISTGIWKSVEIVGWNDFKIENIDIDVISLNPSKAVLQANFDVHAVDNTKLYVRLIEPNTEINFKGYHLRKGLNIKQLDLSIDNPRYWWPRGYGEHVMYDFVFEFSLHPDFRNSKRKSIKTGLRKIKLERDKDEYGSSFYFRINDKPVHVKGVNFVPTNIFERKNSKHKIRNIIMSAYDANVNLIRIWGGGTYQPDFFYDLCDSLGIMVWQDFMFANGFSPATEEFVDNVSIELQQELKRLQHHPCIVTYCGNNGLEQFWQENESLFGSYYSYAQSSKIYRDYEVLFKELMNQLVSDIDSEVPYLSSVPIENETTEFLQLSRPLSPKYLAFNSNEVPRFISAYGFPAYPGLGLLEKYMDESKINEESEVLKRRQKLPEAADAIRNNLKLYYRTPISFDGLVYYSQLLQAKFLNASINEFRLNNDKCGGAIQWYLQDAWPGISFGTIDFEGGWKAAQYALKDRYKSSIIIHTIKNNKIELYAHSDARRVKNATLSIQLKTFKGKTLMEDSISFTLIPDRSIQLKDYFINGLAPGNLKANSYLKVRLKSNEELLDERIITFLPEKYLNLSKPQFQFSIESGDTVAIDLSSDVFAKNVMLDFGEMQGHFSENYFDLEPDTVYHVKFIPLPEQKSTTFLSIQSIVDF